MGEKEKDALLYISRFIQPCYKSHRRISVFEGRAGWVYDGGEWSFYDKRKGDTSALCTGDMQGLVAKKIAVRFRTPSAEERIANGRIRGQRSTPRHYALAPDGQLAASAQDGLICRVSVAAHIQMSRWYSLHRPVLKSAVIAVRGPACHLNFL